MHFKALNLQNKPNYLKVLKTLISITSFSNQTYLYIKNTDQITELKLHLFFRIINFYMYKLN